MKLMERDQDIVTRIEFFIRRLFERIGGAFDFALRRGAANQGGLRTDLSALIPQIERAIESDLRREKSRIVAPNLIELRYDYETYTRMGEGRRDYLQRELTSNAHEFTYNRRYALLAKMRVTIAYDAFTRGLEITTGFGEYKEPIIARAKSGRELREQPARHCQVILRSIVGGRELIAQISSDAEPAGVGRNIANKLVIKDPDVSNFHAAFLLRPDGNLELADRSSANGTYVNGILLGAANKTIVRDGDRVRFGDVEMLLTVSMLDGK